MSVRKIHNSWWVDFRHEFQRFRKKSPENSRAGARAYEALLRQRLARGDQLAKPAPVYRFAEFALTWMDAYVAANNKLSERQMKASILSRHLLPFFGRMRLDGISVEDIERFKAKQRGADLCPKTINNHLTVLGRCLRSAVEWGRLSAAPRVALLRASSRRVDFLSGDECERLIADQADPQLNRMVLTALRTGLRIGELLGLSWTDVDLATGILTVQRSWVRGEMSTTKSHRVRHVPLTRDLREQFAVARRAQGLVFPTEDGRPRTPSTALLALRRACRRSGIRPAGWHLLRHTFASHLAMKGVSLRIVQQLLGHSTIAMTERYAHLSPSSLLEAVRLLEPTHDVLGQPVGNTPVPAYQRAG